MSRGTRTLATHAASRRAPAPIRMSSIRGSTKIRVNESHKNASNATRSIAAERHRAAAPTSAKAMPRLESGGANSAARRAVGQKASADETYQAGGVDEA